jgi:hypothetical protein
MTHTISMKSAHLLGVLLAYVSLATSDVLQAQPHPPPEPPDTRWLVLPEDRLSDEELRGANPCRRVRMPEKLITTIEYQRLGWLPLCVQKTRSQAFSAAWEKGLDQHGVQLDAGAPARKIAEMQVWLRRLSGKYRNEGKYWNSGGSSPIHGTADCFGIGSGAGVSCVISTKWKAPKESGDPRTRRVKDWRLDEALYSAMRGLVLLFGVDPGASRVRVTLADFRGVGMSGFLDDGVVMFAGRPNIDNSIGNLVGNALVTYTWENSLVATKPGGDLDMKFLVRAVDIVSTPHPILFDLHLHREQPARVQ